MPHQQLRKERMETRKPEALPAPEQYGEGGSPAFEVENSPAEILRLQHTIGNQATNRLLQTRRRSIIQRNGSGDAPSASPAPDPASIPAPAPALSPDDARSQFATLLGTSLTALKSALTITENASEVSRIKPDIEAPRAGIQTRLEKLRGQPKAADVEVAITFGESALETVDAYIARIDQHIRSVTDAEQAEAEGRPHPAIWTGIDPQPPMPAPAPSPAPAPAPAPPPQPIMPVAPGRGPVMIPGDPGATKGERAKGAVMSALGAHKIEKDVGLIGEQDAAKMAKNAHSHYAQSPSSTIVPDPDGTKTSAMFAPLHAVGAQVKTFAVGAADKVVGWLHPLLAFLDTIPGVSILVGLVTTGKAAHSAYKRRASFFEALKAVRIRGDESRVPTKADMELRKTTKYAYHKTNRAFWGNIGRFFASLVKYIFRLITILTGGTSALATETAALVIDVAQAVEGFGRRLKGLIKSLFGRRGKHRRENAAMVYKHALDGDPIALNLLLELKPFGTWDSMKSKLRIQSLPRTGGEMQIYLQQHDKPSEEKAMIMEIAAKMKST